MNVIPSLARILDAFDKNLSMHSKQVAYWSGILANAYGMSKEAIHNVKLAAYLHDIGKIGISKNILNKNGPLDSYELSIIKKHPVIGRSIVKSISGLPIEVINGVYLHHERWDGTGYPEKLKGEKIPVVGRILGITDAWSAMTMDRPYRLALTQQQALGELVNGIGKQFDPYIANCFIDVISFEQNNVMNV